ncbi:peptidoglycan recognition protein family protein [Actinopolyspora halophila]|uniref:peptidoglycan recognition protein family protein n=1 Tax=Actinopolyspora halophila TaxID=1850 RepID=UPI0003825E0D|nr:peptidoglycan recognition protein [Actinopolyspora halophila]
MFRELTAGTVALATAVLLATGVTAQETARADPHRPARTTAERVDLSTVPTARGREDTRTVRTDRPFSMIGLTWNGPTPDRLRVRARTGKEWDEWHALEPLGTSHAPEARGHGHGSPAGATRARWTGPTSAVQVRARHGGADVTGRLRLIAIRPASAPAPEGPDARGPRPPVVTRAQWGADESLMRWPPQHAATTRAAVIHHTVETNDYTCAESARVVRGLYHYHAAELGWGDIGYQVLIDKCGTVFEGRTGGLDGHVIGGHTKGFNAQTFGVALLGNFQTARPSERALASAGAIAGWKLGTVGRDPLGRTTLVSGGGADNKYPEGTSVTLPRIFSHRDVSDTACPGRNLYARLDDIRKHAAG